MPGCQDVFGECSLVDCCKSGIGEKAQDCYLCGAACFCGIPAVISDLCYSRARKALRSTLCNEPLAVQPLDLPQPWGSLLRDGQVLASLILSSAFSDKYKGSKMQLGEMALVRLPKESTTWQPKLLHKIGRLEAAAYLWLGDEARGDQTLYVAFSMMKKFISLKKLMFGSLVSSSGSSSACRDWEELPVIGFLRSEINRLWDEDGFGRLLSKESAAYPKHRIIFAGVSHGAALAQAVAVRYNLTKPRVPAAAVSWNSYKWTDKAGRELIRREMGDDLLLPFVLTERSPSKGGGRYWDSISGGPAGFVGMPRSWLLDVDTGTIISFESKADCPGEGKINYETFKRFWRLHFASAAITGTRCAMVTAIESGR